MPVEVYIDDIVRLRKIHPCGSYEWRVVRLGADIGLKCLKCGHRILLPRSTFERRLKAFVSRSEMPFAPGGDPWSLPLGTGTPSRILGGKGDPTGEHPSRAAQPELEQDPAPQDSVLS
jgi:hypothetical protein